MKRTKHEIFQLLLNLHKQLLEEQKTVYEKEYGIINSTNEYYQLVVSHKDFEWLRQLSALIASLDEILESSDQDIKGISEEIIMLLSGDGDKHFYERLKSFTKDNQVATQTVLTIIESLKNPTL